MTDFECTVCGSTFQVPEDALKKYPNWVPKYCRQHSPRKTDSKNKSGPKKRAGGGAKSKTAELDLPLEEVLIQYTEGPESGVFTDGSARPNPGPGGWGVVWVKDGEVIEQRYGKEGHTTNNRMELVALIEAFKLLPGDTTETIYTDSELSLNILTKWATSWEKNGWKRKSGPIKNLDLVKEAFKLYQERPKIKIEWIKAHVGWRWNEYADSLATAWARDVL